ncbi:MAG: biopolymer transporter ExbD [Bdellovibrionaceae bacterium]|nr:biopolymer transporter ExbD [Pseudobdellovibrionaceae bacterium]
MGASIRNNDEQIAEINIVPFVDIILVVLIIFMVTAPMIITPSIKIDLPKASSGTKTAASPLNISISRTGRVRINGKVISSRHIIAKIKRLLRKNKKLQAIISADKNVAHGKVISVIDKVKSAGIFKFAISIDKK